ncbi:MAG: CRISPR-associated protein [Promethearchaeota archaeon]
MARLDFYSEYAISHEQEVDDLVNGRGRYEEIDDVMVKASLLSTALDRDGLKDFAKVGNRGTPSGLKLLTHDSPAYDAQIQCRLSEMHVVGLNRSIDITNLPKGTMALEISITLEKPFMSRDDVPLYIIDASARKDKVFGVPVTSAMAWKGNLRWTMMKLFLESRRDNPEDFLKTRIEHTILFGTEKGTRNAGNTGWAKYMDELCRKAETKYKDQLKTLFNTECVPNLEGHLHFYPTFWNKIDLDIINPHDRTTGAGTNPIHLEIVPAGAKGVFRLLHVPFYGKKPEGANLFDTFLEIVQGLKEMMLTYGFSAKKSSGLGIIKDNWDAEQACLEVQGFDSVSKKFSNFDELIGNLKSLHNTRSGD